MKLLFSRMKRVTTAKAHAQVDAIEDPVSMLDQVVRERAQALTSARIALKQAKYWLNRIEDQMTGEARTMEDMENAALQALDQEQEMVAKQAVMRKQAATARHQDLQQQHQRALQAHQRQQQQVESLEASLCGLKEKRMLLRQRAMFVQSARQYSGTSFEVDESAETIVERMEERIGMAEAMLGADAPIPAETQHNELNQFMENQQVELELIRLREKRSTNATN